MKILVRVGAVVTICMAVAGCELALEPGDGGLVLERDAAVVAAGESVTISLLNLSRDNVGHNLCLSDLQQFENWRWIPAPVTGTGWGCYLVISTLNPGSSASFSVPLSPDLPPGTYRLRTKVIVHNADRYLATPQFSITTHE